MSSERLTTKPAAAKATYTPHDIAERWNCSHGTILAHIYSGELFAIDISTNRKGRARYVIPAESLEAFEESRRVQKPASKPARRAKVRQGDVIEFFS